MKNISPFLRKAMQQIGEVGSKSIDNIKAVDPKEAAAFVKSFSKEGRDKLLSSREATLKRKIASRSAEKVSLNETGNGVQRAARRIVNARPHPFNVVQPSVTNAFTGYEVKPGLDNVLATGAMAFGVGVAAVQANTIDTRAPVRSDQAGSLQGLSYDAVANTSAGRRDLGATGELVFGLHNQRRG